MYVLVVDSNFPNTGQRREARREKKIGDVHTILGNSRVDNGTYIFIASRVL